MTPQELEIYRLKVQMEALRVVVRIIVGGLARSSPIVAQRLLEQFASLRLEHSQIALKGVDPGVSDLAAAEYQEALEDLLSFIEEVIQKPMPKS